MHSTANITNNVAPAIRSATPADAAILNELGASTFRETFDGTTSPENMAAYMSAAFTIEALAAELADPKSTFFIVESNQEAIAYLKLYDGGAPACVSDPNAIELSRLYVKQEFIAQKIGALLMQKALDEARNKGCKTIFLGVWEHNERAKIFYHKWGFVKAGEHIFQMGDDPQIDWWMERKL